MSWRHHPTPTFRSAAAAPSHTPPPLNHLLILSTELLLLCIEIELIYYQADFTANERYADDMPMTFVRWPFSTHNDS
jgi:hypothetical protein